MTDPSSINRRLAAILAADVVGYSRLMEQDEAGTLAALKARRREVVEPLVAKHQGRVFKVAGDGVLIEFASAVNAVQCAVDLQQAMAAANEAQPDDRQIVLRIGVNLGDVMVESGDLYGDGVNIASRLETIAEPGGILISSTAHDYVHNKLKARFEDLGAQALKNIAEPVRVYRVAGTPTVAIAPSHPTTRVPAIAVLPLDNMSGDPEQQYFSDGITEDIITELSRFRSLLVIARNSSFQYRTATDVKRIGRELGVDYVAEGSVRKSGRHLRITAQLIEAATGNHTWAEHYDRDIQDLFAVQDEVARAIATTIEGRMAATGAQRLRRKPTEDMAAYDCFLQARDIMQSRGDGEAADQLLQRAVKLDPTFAHAYAWLSRHQIFLFHLYLRPEYLSKALTYADVALSLDEGDAWSHNAMGYACFFNAQLDLAGIHLERAMALNPMDVRITSMRALWLAFIGEAEEAIRILDADLQRDPYPPGWFWNFRGITMFQARQYDEVRKAYSRLPRKYPWDHYYLVAALAHLGLLDQAQAECAELLRARPTARLADVPLTEPFKHPRDLEHLLDGLRKAGLPG